MVNSLNKSIFSNKHRYEMKRIRLIALAVLLGFAFCESSAKSFTARQNQTAVSSRTVNPKPTRLLGGASAT